MAPEPLTDVLGGCILEMVLRIPTLSAGAPKGDRSSHRWPLPLSGMPKMGGSAKTAEPFPFKGVFL